MFYIKKKYEIFQVVGSQASEPQGPSQSQEETSKASENPENTSIPGVSLEIVSEVNEDDENVPKLVVSARLV